MKLKLDVHERAVLTQVASSNGIWAGNLVSKFGRKGLYEAGLVHPLCGANRVHLTPRGKAYAESIGLHVAPFSWTTPKDLLEQLKLEACSTATEYMRTWDWYFLACSTEL